VEYGERLRGGSPQLLRRLPRHSRVTRSGESLPSNPDAGPARIIRKELAGNEEFPSKQICFPLAPARVRHIVLLADSRVSGIRPGGRGLILSYCGLLFANVFAAALALNRKFFLKDTGRKLAHLDKQFNVGHSDVPAEISEEE
jgi:hypothetical protein